MSNDDEQELDDIATLGATTAAATNPDLDPALRALAERAAEITADRRRGRDK
ncbi:hypothetical protein [Streptomyces sp. CA-111067]|uniref:hypothetical protein n=1 Tax=Streptomyces sp. CA-111067 TaxID=3240046 RepID=UPI003D956DF6